MRRIVWASIVTSVMFLAAAADGNERFELADLTFERDREGLYVTMEVRGAFTKAVREALHSGVPLSFQYTIKLRRKRPLWFDKTVIGKQIETRAKLDVLSREWKLSRSMDGRVLHAKSTTDAGSAMDYMARLPRVKIAEADAVALDTTYDLMAKAKVLDEFVLFVIPWAIETPWQRQSLLTPTSDR